MDVMLEGFDSQWRAGGESRTRAYTLAKDYAAARRQDFAAIADYDIPSLVGLVEAYREAGDEENRILADIWLLASFPPQQIVGEMRVNDRRASAAAAATIDLRASHVRPA